MFRLDRLRALFLHDPAAERRSVSAISVVACLYREWRVAGRELERLGRALLRRHFYGGLQALERACASVRVAEELVVLVERQTASDQVEANLLRRELLEEVRPWLEAARRELPAAADALCSFVYDAKSREAVDAAMRLLDEPLDDAQARPRRNTAS
jgi:hypothetical protein